jgi:uncharacterized membrane-anchored protein YjiN (DUF445 family)
MAGTRRSQLRNRRSSADLKILRPFRLPATPFHRMRLAATLLLLAMAIVFAVASVWQHSHPALPWVRAFAEAALVGGLADWFAVTALFRHPLGLPIPHTAIIPANKDRIGESLAMFLKENFLTPSIVARRLEEFDIAGAVAARLNASPIGPSALHAAPSAAGAAASTGTQAPAAALQPARGAPALAALPAPRKIAPPHLARRRGLGPLLARLIEALDHRVIGDLVREAASDRLAALQLSPMLADAIDTTLDKGRHDPLIESAIGWGLRMLDDQQSTIRSMVSERTNWLLRLVNVDDSVAETLIEGLRRLLTDVHHDPHHPLRRRIAESLRTYAFDLRHFPETQAGVEAIKADLIANPALGNWLAGLWDSARAGLVASLVSPDPAGGGKLAEALQAFGTRLQADAPLRAAINLHLRRAAVGLVHDYGDEIVSLVSDTVRGWDASTVSEKLETAVGRDLQFIRINGTVIGGLVGVTIHAVTVAL